MFSDLGKFFDRTPDYSGALVSCLIIVAITMVVSYLTYRFVEVPARNYFNKVFKTSHPKIKPESVKV